MKPQGISHLYPQGSTMASPPDPVSADRIRANTSIGAVSAAGVVHALGEPVWLQGSHTGPLLLHEGVVAYRRGKVALGLLGPGQGRLARAGGSSSGTRGTGPDRDHAERRHTSFARGGLRRGLSGQRAGAGERRRAPGESISPPTAGHRATGITQMTGESTVMCRQDVLAMAVGARRETVASILSVWREEDWIDTRYRRCKVLNRVALEAIRNRSGRSGSLSR